MFKELRVFCVLFLLPWADLEPELALGPPALAGKVAFRLAEGILAAIGGPAAWAYALVRPRLLTPLCVDDWTEPSCRGW